MSLTLTRQGASTQTHFQYGAQKLRALCCALGFEENTESIVQLFRSFIYPWGETTIGEVPKWPSDITDDHTPFEFSIALSNNQPELRILIEAQGALPTLQSQREAGQALTERLVCDFGIDVERLRLIEDLFLPEEPEGLFSVWHAISLRPNREPEFKIYLNPQAQGEARAAAILEEALDRLGFRNVWSVIAEIAARRGPDKDEFKYFSLDLCGDKAARVKVYVQHHDATVEDLEIALSAASSYVKGDVTEFCQGMTGSEGTFSERPVFTCFSAIDGDHECPSAGTFYLPIRAYASNDEIARELTYGYLAKHNLASAIYQRSLQAFATRSLKDGKGMHSYISFRRERGCPRMSIYLAPEAYKVQPPRLAVTTQKPQIHPPPEEIVHYYEQHLLTEHPFFQRLKREPVNLTYLWILLANLRKGTTQNFARHLTTLIARVEDERIRCILVKQLNDELGEGDFSRAHSVLFDKLLAALAPWRPSEVTDSEVFGANVHCSVNGSAKDVPASSAILAPGQELGRRLKEFYVTKDPYEGVGASIVVEIYGKQVDQCLGDLFRRQQVIAPESLTWVTLHESLEVEHADDSLSLARLVPPSGLPLEAVWRGAQGIATISWSYFNAIYRICFA
jgi:DMATS type aromatic prenyltransferase